MDDHDLQVMIKRAKEFLKDNDKIRLVVKFAGRQIAHPEFGQKIVQSVIDSISDISKIEREPHFEGKQLIAILSPEKSPKGKGAYEEKDQKISQQKV
jgi:translation initiation factor IF-3